MSADNIKSKPSESPAESIADRAVDSGETPPLSPEESPRPAPVNELLIITGMSGAGKSEAAAALEDAGYFCVDNMPPNLFIKFIEGIMVSRGSIDKIALVVDIRGGEFFYMLDEALSQLKDMSIAYDIVFLEAADEVLLRRFKETRRRHPLATYNQTLVECIDRERRLLETLRGMAGVVIDTSGMTGKALSRYMLSVVSQREETAMMVSAVSFGFKYGLPLDADLVFDVRFLPNPFYIPALKPLSGLDDEVRDYVTESDITAEFLKKTLSLLGFLLEAYLKEGKKYLMIAIGCTGGQHRSVAVCEEIAVWVREQGFNCHITHRDMNRSRSGHS